MACQDGLGPFLYEESTNAAALASDRAAGFRPADPHEEERFNRGQSRRYVWMRRAAG